MGCAPSLEVACEAPFRPPQGGVRQVALIPIIGQYFPSADCALFQQLYDAYTDPSVRYYMRPDFDGVNGDLSCIPPIMRGRAELHQLLLQHTAKGIFATNADLRAAFDSGEHHRIRPVLCAVVFLYDGANYVPEGSVQLPSRGRGPAVFVKVIGVVGDTSKMWGCLCDPPHDPAPLNAMRMQTLITKSAGDHNMARVVLLSSYIYYHQCVEVVGMPQMPTMAANFRCFKTNIPFLCFLREMRDRTSLVLEAPKDSKFYIDEHCLHGAVSAEYVAMMVPAFAHYFIAFLNAKSEMRLMKQLAHQQRCLNGGKDRANNSATAQTEGGGVVLGLTCPLPTSGSEDTMSTTTPAMGNGMRNQSSVNAATASSSEDSIRAMQQVANSSKGTDESGGVVSSLARTMSSAALATATRDMTTTAPKITFIVKGYLTRPVTTLSAWSAAPNEVYVTCMDGEVRVVDRRSVDAVDGPTPTPVLEQPAGIEEIEAERGPTTPTAVAASSSSIVEVVRVRRGDILSFYTPEAEKVRASDADSDNNGDGEDASSSSSSRADLLRLQTDDDNEATEEAAAAAAASHTASSARSDPADEEEEKKDKSSAVTAPAPRKGSWRIDENIFLESVLLSLVRDECKLAREAGRDDPRWVHDDVHHCPMHDGSFYVWRFRRGRETFYYGTVPKFANASRTQGRAPAAVGNAGSNMVASRNGSIGATGNSGMGGGGGGKAAGRGAAKAVMPTANGAPTNGATGATVADRNTTQRPANRKADAAAAAGQRPGPSHPPQQLQQQMRYGLHLAGPSAAASHPVQFSSQPAYATYAVTPNGNSVPHHLYATAPTPTQPQPPSYASSEPQPMTSAYATSGLPAGGTYIYAVPSTPPHQTHAQTSYTQLSQPAYGQQRVSTPTSAGTTGSANGSAFAVPRYTASGAHALYPAPPSPQYPQSDAVWVIADGGGNSSTSSHNRGATAPYTPPRSEAGAGPVYVSMQSRPPPPPPSSAAGVAAHFSSVPSSAIPCYINAQGQLVPLSAVQPNHVAEVPVPPPPSSVMQLMRRTPPAQPSTQTPQFVIVNGQLCVLQPAVTTSTPANVTVQAQAFPSPQSQQPHYNSMYFLPS